MHWSDCFSNQSLLKDKSSKVSRSQFQRDFDRLIFSSPFRRLQSKTQVFPLPGSLFVHNRLTHSLEVASVGRSLGALVGEELAKNDIDKSDKAATNFYLNQLSNVIASACLAHDIGNPAFGHSGEKAISNYFKSFENKSIDGQSLRSFYSDREWSDLINFEGNANALRVLTKAYKGKSKYGVGLTATTLVSILKYPCESIAVDKSQKHTKKYGFFQSEKDTFLEIVDMLNLSCQSEDPIVYKRHPFVYLVEAADDICYNIMDMEDANRINILSTKAVEEAFLGICEPLSAKAELDRIASICAELTDDNERIAYLRAKCINVLVNACAKAFISNKNMILSGSFNSSLIDEIAEVQEALDHVQNLSLNKIYRHPSVLEIEIAGFNVMSELLQMYIPAALRSSKTALDKTALMLIPEQFKGELNGDNAYLKTMNILDHISSMTDVYATELYRKMKGIDITRAKI